MNDPRLRAIAACRGLDPDLFFPERGASLAPAKAVCATCPVTEACLEYALEHHEPGVWGGTGDIERRRIRRERRDAVERVCAGCPVVFTPANAQQLYHDLECRQAAKNAKARRQRAA